jgi:hypothetical protein
MKILYKIYIGFVFRQLEAGNMFPISKRYDINAGVMAKREPKDVLENPNFHKKLIYLPGPIMKLLEQDAERCGRSSVKHIEAIIVSYLGVGYVDLFNMDEVRGIMAELGAGTLPAVPVSGRKRGKGRRRRRGGGEEEEEEEEF